MRRRQSLNRNLPRPFERYDFLVCDNSLHLPCPIEDEALVDISHDAGTRAVQPVGRPSAEPIVWLERERPAALVSIRHALRRERELLSVCAAYEHATPCKDRRPPL